MFTSNVNHDSFVVTHPSDSEIRMTRLFDAPRELVFDAMTRPEHLRHWWGIIDEESELPVCEIDLRPGGAWRFVHRHGQLELAFHGEYQEIQPPDRLVFTEIYEAFPNSVSVVSVVTTEFADEGGVTRMTMTARYPSREVRDIVLSTGMTSGAAISYDRLEDLLAAWRTSR